MYRNRSLAISFAGAKIKDEQKRQDLIQVAIAQNLSLVQINERVKAASKAVTVNPLKERYKIALPRLQKSKVWDNPKNQKALEKLLIQIEALIDELCYLSKNTIIFR